MKFECFHLGQRFTTGSHTVTAEEIHNFAVLYDPQPFHLDRDFARRTSFGDIIAPGEMTLSIAWGLFARTNVLGEDSRGGIGLDEVRWTAPVYPGDTLTCEVSISALRRTSKGDKGVLTLDFDLRNQHGQTVLRFKSLSMAVTEQGAIRD
ncbi:MAG: MaoC family dehydratase N-terminal domain-containing protein [Chloroflexi bacterium]|nr:MaoC family dehydratase N-terminal domain-containing protein [Chloroflexota bacterium]MBI4503969.1 MaoC family dehydratase N-terminal domain-containing protein [Chloroflexota bacterium]